MEVELTVVEFTYVQAVTHEELDLYTKLAQSEQRYALGEPKLVVYFPYGRVQVALH